MTALNAIGAAQASALIKAGELTSEQLVRACLDHIAARDPTIRAWTYIDADQALRQAREIDKGPYRGPLHGIPIGVKDMIDTADMPTTHNSPIFQGHRPGQDAAAVATLRAAGAIILGKTDTTEFAAAGRQAWTRNPHDITRTPGGSSAGSAAAVADSQVPLALGTQTGGSTIRPASFCGVFALKPTWGAVSREGVKLYSMTLDTISWFARDLADLGMLCDVFDLHDDTPPPTPAIHGLKIALCRSPAWPEAEPATQAALDDTARRLQEAGATVATLDLPEEFGPLGDMQRIVMHGEGRAAFLSLARSHPHLLHDEFVSRVENRDGITRAELAQAYDHAALCRTRFDAIAGEYDAILTPSAKGEAPAGRNPGNAVFNRMWTLLHVPCVNIPTCRDPGALPVGVTLTAPRYHDRRLLAVSAVVAQAIG